jgi:hypothetical protein
MGVELDAEEDQAADHRSQWWEGETAAVDACCCCTNDSLSCTRSSRVSLDDGMERVEPDL